MEREEKMQFAVLIDAENVSARDVYKRQGDRSYNEGRVYPD